MAKKWFDGLFPYSTENLINEFPVEISPCLRPQNPAVSRILFDLR